MARDWRALRREWPADLHYEGCRRRDARARAADRSVSARAATGTAGYYRMCRNALRRSAVGGDPLDAAQSRQL
jgi:hypothetical protein